MKGYPMNGKARITLTPEQETLLITLYFSPDAASRTCRLVLTLWGMSYT